VFHKKIYPRLSLVAHQSYGYLERESVDFDDNYLTEPAWRTEAVHQYLNVITASILLRIRNDVGLGADDLIKESSNRAEWF
jgi:hypothetical protein